MGCVGVKGGEISQVGVDWGLELEVLFFFWVEGGWVCGEFAVV